MSIITNGIGNTPTMDSRATFNHVAVANEVVASKIPKTANDGAKQNTVKKVENKVENKVVQNASANELRYNVNEKLDQVIVKIVDSTTNKVIKEIPSTETQQMKIRIKDAIGNFIDESR